MANNLPAKQEISVNAYLKNDKVKKRFAEILGKNAPAFLSTIISLCNASEQLKKCDPQTIVSAAALAATLNLPVTPSLGQAYIIPYKDQAQFQIGTKGILQLALRSGQYRCIHVSEIYEGQIEEIDNITGQIIRGKKISNTIVGYAAHMELINGFKKTLYMTLPEIEQYAEKFSPSYAYDKRNGKKSSLWSTNFDAMAKKTVLKKLLRQYGILSIDQQCAELNTALNADQTVINEKTNEIPDIKQFDTPNTSAETIDVTPAEVNSGARKDPF